MLIGPFKLDAANPLKECVEDIGSSTKLGWGAPSKLSVYRLLPFRQESVTGLRNFRRSNSARLIPFRSPTLRPQSS